MSHCTRFICCNLLWCFSVFCLFIFSFHSKDHHTLHRWQTVDHVTVRNKINHQFCCSNICDRNNDGNDFACLNYFDLVCQFMSSKKTEREKEKRISHAFTFSSFYTHIHTHTRIQHNAQANVEHDKIALTKIIMVTMITD